MPELEPVRIGLIGCGVISHAYLTISRRFPILKFVACADLRHAVADATAAKFNLAALPVPDLLASDQIDLILNLTIPSAHGEVNLAAIEHGKHTYCEKPLDLDVESASRVLQRAQTRDLRIGCAPDTFLGGGYQSVRHLLDGGAIGKPLSGTAFMMGHGHESWHPAPAFYYKLGGGPLFDMGPYYLTALVQALGPVKRVAAITGRGFNRRTITSKPNAGEFIEVEVNTHASGTLEFHNGVIITLVMSFDVWNHTNRFIELHGTEHSLACPDPNGFGGKVALSGPGRTWNDMPLTHGNHENCRSIGLADMCVGIRTGRSHRASGELAFHILEVMAAFDKSSSTGRHVSINSRPERPSALPPGLGDAELD